MKPLYVFTDLDDTLFQSLRKSPRGEPLYPAAVDRSGAVIGWMTASQRRWFDAWRTVAAVIPVTARSSEVYRRVTLPFADGAVVSCGGVILSASGELDLEWDQRIRPQAARAEAGLEAAYAAARRFCEQRGLDLRVQLIRDREMPLYLEVKDRRRRTGPLRRLVESGALPEGPGWRREIGPAEACWLPSFLGKEKAVQHLLDRLESDNVMTLGIGDSVSDWPFMQLCDAALAPRGAALSHWLVDGRKLADREIPEV